LANAKGPGSVVVKIQPVNEVLMRAAEQTWQQR
jgi:hypothetical protein